VTISVEFDTAGPVITISVPTTIRGQGPTFPVAITGQATDSQSSVAQVEYKMAAAAFANARPRSPGDWSTWSADATLPAPGSYTLEVRAADHFANQTTQAVQIVAIAEDTTPPNLQITDPIQNPLKIPGTPGATTVLKGSAADTQSGVASVKWTLNGSSEKDAYPAAPGDWSTWSASVVFPALGTYEIGVRAVDNAGNASAVVRQAHVVAPGQLADPNHVFSPRAYLADLLDFAVRYVAAGASPVTRQLLSDVFHQPFDALATGAAGSAAEREVHEARLAIEILRRFLAANTQTGPFPTIESRYRDHAYMTLLIAIGTSYEEIRLSRAAATQARSALAERLGFRLDAARPDQLQQLLLNPGAVTEADLDTLFGLRSTTSDPLTPGSPPEPKVLAWRLAALRDAWERQDHPPQPVAAKTPPIVDPDLITLADLKDAVAGNAAYDLLRVRADWVDDRFTRLRSIRESIAGPAQGFSRILEETFGPQFKLKPLAEARRRGESIEQILEANYLSLEAFLYLAQIEDLAATDSVLPSEWSDVTPFWCR
jgi:hypothetical protein